MAAVKAACDAQLESSEGMAMGDVDARGTMDVNPAPPKTPWLMIPLLNTK